MRSHDINLIMEKSHFLYVQYELTWNYEVSIISLYCFYLRVFQIVSQNSLPYFWAKMVVFNENLSQTLLCLPQLSEKSSQRLFLLRNSTQKWAFHQNMLHFCGTQLQQTNNIAKKRIIRHKYTSSILLSFLGHVFSTLIVVFVIFFI